jgi:hypothetical protein
VGQPPYTSGRTGFKPSGQSLTLRRLRWRASGVPGHDQRLGAAMAWPPLLRWCGHRPGAAIAWQRPFTRAANPPRLRQPATTGAR